MEDSINEIEIPCYFLCPISMQLMRDPVTVSTGITYDCENIEKWLFTCKNKTCPVTKVPLKILNSPEYLTPNHTLRRLIQAWCTLNAHERIPTPKYAAGGGRSQVLKLLQQAKNSPEKPQLINCLHRLRSIAVRDDSGRTHLQAAGAAEFLASVVRDNEDTISRDEALSVLHRIDLPDPDLKKLVTEDNGKFVTSLIDVLVNGNVESRSQAVTLLKSAFDVADPDLLIGSEPELFRQITRVLSDKISPQATKSALKLLMELCPWGRNRLKAVGAGAVYVLVELLLETSERRLVELAMTVLDQLCCCAEGRAELLSHGAGIAVVSKKILRVSHGASEKGVRVLSSISKHTSASSKVVQEMMQVGVVSKLCLVLQVESGQKTKERAKEILRRHSRVWRDSSCTPAHLLSCYP